MSRRLMGLSLAALAAAGCAWGPGTGFGTIAPTSFVSMLAVGAERFDAAGGWKTDNGYVVTLDGRRMQLNLKDVSLQGAGSTPQSASTTFDPANPPAGYTLCHGGHCHRADGALVDYADVQAELSKGSGASAPTTLVTLVPAAPGLTVLPGILTSVGFGSCAPNCDLPKGTIVRAPLRIASLTASGRTVSAPGVETLPNGGVSWTLTLHDVTLTGPALALAIDRNQPATFTFEGGLALSDRLFDGLDWARLAASGGSVELDADAPTHELLVANLAKSTWTPTFTSSASPSPTPTAEAENADTEGCEHLAEGPAVAVAAAASPGPAAPLVGNDHRRYDMSLPNGSGVVKLQSAEAGTYVFFTSASASLAVTDATGAAVAIAHADTASSVCTDVKGRFEVPLGVGVYYVNVKAASSVNVVIEQEEGDGHDH